MGAGTLSGTLTASTGGGSTATFTDLRDHRCAQSPRP